MYLDHRGRRSKKKKKIGSRQAAEVEREKAEKEEKEKLEAKIKLWMMRSMEQSRRCHDRRLSLLLFLLILQLASRWSLKRDAGPNRVALGPNFVDQLVKMLLKTQGRH